MRIPRSDAASMSSWRASIPPYSARHVEVVGHVIAPVTVRARGDGIEPDPVDSEPSKMVEPLDHPSEIADAVAVGVLEGTRVDLVKHPTLPPVIRVARISRSHRRSLPRASTVEPGLVAGRLCWVGDGRCRPSGSTPHTNSYLQATPWRPSSPRRRPASMPRCARTISPRGVNVRANRGTPGAGSAQRCRRPVPR